MHFFWNGIVDGFALIFSGDRSVLEAAWCSIWISSLAVASGSLIGIPLGMLLARRKLPALLNSMGVLACRVAMSLPTVFVGLLCYGLFKRQGPMGDWDLLYSPWAIVIGEFMLAMPIVATWTHGAIQSLDDRVHETAFTLGAGQLRRARTYLAEARLGVMLAVLTAFARCFTELGVAMIAGGNLAGHTRTLTTATALERERGDFSEAVATSIVLLVIAMTVTLLVAWCGRSSKELAR